jgi:hypothetical protein
MSGDLNTYSRFRLSPMKGLGLMPGIVYPGAQSESGIVANTLTSVAAFGEPTGTRSKLYYDNVYRLVIFSKFLKFTLSLNCGITRLLRWFREILAHKRNIGNFM